MTRLIAPIFHFGDAKHLADTDSHLREGDPTGPFAMTGPGATAEPGHLPVRGDLAHIKLAGRYFVPHYAVPMPHKITGGSATLRKVAGNDGEVLQELKEGTVFNVLDITGSWAWGQVGEEGFVGYLPTDRLIAA